MFYETIVIDARRSPSTFRWLSYNNGYTTNQYSGGLQAEGCFWGGELLFVLVANKRAPAPRSVFSFVAALYILRPRDASPYQIATVSDYL